MEASQARDLGRTRLSFADTAEIDEFVTTLEAYERGELTPDQWRAFRLVRGTYGQRQTGDAQMLRVKIPQGILGGEELRALADVAETYSRGFGHITTRQNLQFHFVKLHDVELAMRRLEQAGLTTREACGSAVRNITACPHAGVAHDEVFDVTPYAEALTRFLLRHPLGSALPRKFKIAFEGCAEDHALTAINDIGFRAAVRDGRRGFRVTAGGGTSILCKSGFLLEDFLPAGEILDLAESLLRVFQRLGDYKHKQRNRMKFLIKELGVTAWLAQVEEERARIRSAGGTRLPFPPDAPPVETAPAWRHPEAPSREEAERRATSSRLSGPGLLPVVRPQITFLHAAYERWRATNVARQKQQGYAVVTVTVPLGDLTGEQMRLLAELAAAYGDGTVRTTNGQNLLFRWVRVSDVAELYGRLTASGLGSAEAGTVADPASCPGAEACRLAVTQSRGLGRSIAEHLGERPDLVESARGLDIRISGCPNGCGLHHVAGIGFQGSVRQVGGKAVPQYFVSVGGGFEGGHALFGRLVAKIPAHRVAEGVERLLELCRLERNPGETAPQFFRRVEPSLVKAALADLEALTPTTAEPRDFVDLGDEAEFKAEVLEGECSA